MRPLPTNRTWRGLALTTLVLWAVVGSARADADAKSKGKQAIEIYALYAQSQSVSLPLVQ
jgi:hypothetical protein